MPCFPESPTTFKFVLLFFLVISCAHSKKEARPSDSVTSKETNITTAPILEKNSKTQTEKQEEPPVAVVDPANLKLLLTRIQDVSTPLSDEDEQSIWELHESQTKGTVQEAIQILGLARSALKQSPTQSTLPAESIPSFENLIATRHIDVLTAMSQNTELQSPNSRSLLRMAVQSHNNNAKFRDDILMALAKAEGTAVVQAPSPPTSTKRNYYADLQSDDELLVDAQRLAAEKQFVEAIAKAGTISQDSPLLETAKDLIRSYSNQAVNALRQKAALAFQQALPIQEPKTKASFLEDAKKYLEEALANFPQADQINTVKENLTIVQRDLSQLSQ